MRLEPIKVIRYKKRRRLGDIVAQAAKPVVVISDRYLGTDLANCKGCKKRQTALNKIAL